MKREMKTSEILFKARDIQLTRGRAVGDYENARGGVCMIGAISLAYDIISTKPLQFNNTNAYAALREVTNMSQISSFSDKHCKTKYDMAAAFEIAACCSAAKGD